MKVVVDTVYFGNIDYYQVLKEADEILVEVCQHFEKQSYKNRCEIYGANGKLGLSVPLQRTGSRTPIKDVRIDYSADWRKLHYKSIESAYRSSAYYEFYEDDLLDMFSNQYEFLIDLNRASHELMSKWLKVNFELIPTTSFIKEYKQHLDLREEIHPKKQSTKGFESLAYFQVFDSKIGFQPNLSVLDVIFNEGPNAVTYLDKKSN